MKTNTFIEDIAVPLSLAALILAIGVSLAGCASTGVHLKEGKDGGFKLKQDVFTFGGAKQDEGETTFSYTNTTTTFPDGTEVNEWILTTVSGAKAQEGESIKEIAGSVLGAGGIVGILKALPVAPTSPIDLVDKAMDTGLVGKVIDGVLKP